MNTEWVFDPSPPSASRSGGSAAEYSFEGRIDILVREVVQNSLDARLGDDQPVTVRFRLLELSGECLEQFQEGLSWETLQDNLRAVPSSRGGQRIHQAVDAMETEDKLRVLVIEDFGTTGLIGTERRESDDKPNCFCALVKDELYSDKASEDAGGSFGLGKSLLWAYSNLKTVVFASMPSEHPKACTGMRLIARASLPYHMTEEDGPCKGDGWLGVRHGHDRAEWHAESIWGVRAAELAEQMRCARHSNQTGLSAVILGFSEPGLEDRGAEEMIDSIEHASLDSFWPAMSRGRLRIEVHLERNETIEEERTIDPMRHEAFCTLAELLQEFDRDSVQEKTTLADGEHGLQYVPIRVPCREKPPRHSEFTGQVALLVSLIPDEEEFALIKDRIFRFRKPGMVVRSSRSANLSINARPYAALVVCGLACGNGDEHDHVERFLRCAEPPAHDEWTHNTRRIKDDYVERGCRARLDEFDRELKKAIREMISRAEERGGRLPDALLKHLRFGDKGGGGRARFISVTRSHAHVEDGAWVFTARCRRIVKGTEPWHVAVHLNYAMDGGGADDVHAICAIDSNDASRAEVSKGVGLLEFPPEVTSARFTGRTDSGLLPAIGTRSAIRLRIDGAKGGLPDA